LTGRPRPLFQHFLGGCNDEVLAFKGLYFADLRNIDAREVTQHIILPSERSTTMYSKIKSDFLDTIGNEEYYCYHVRLGDFISMCEQMENPEQYPEMMASIPPSYLKTFHEYTCHVTPEILASTIIDKKYPAF